MSMRDSMMAALRLLQQQQQQQDQATLANAARQPIPGFTGPAGSGAGIPGGGVGMAPPQQPLPAPGQALQPFMATGPYGQQALQLAGLAGGHRGNHMMNPAWNMQTQQGLLGAPKGFRVPFYRPPGNFYRPPGK